MGRWRRATPYFPHFELASTIFFFSLSLFLFRCSYITMFFFPVLSHSSLQLRIRFFHSPYQVILSYFVFFVPSIFLLLLLSYFSFAPPQFLSLSLDAGIVYIFFLLSPSYYIKGLSFSLSLLELSMPRMLERHDASPLPIHLFFLLLSLILGSTLALALCPAFGGPRYRFVSLPSTPYLSSPERRTRCIRAAFSSLHQENFFWFRFLASCPTLERCNFRRVFFYEFLFPYDRNIRPCESNV